MKFSVEKRDGGLCIRIENLAGREHAVLDTLRECRKNSAWACPSGECVNIETMEARVTDGVVYLTVTPRSGAELSPTSIEECMRYMLGA